MVFVAKSDQGSPELEGIAPLLPEHVHQLLRHPVYLGLSKLHYVERNIVQQRQAVSQQTRVLNTKCTKCNLLLPTIRNSLASDYK